MYIVPLRWTAIFVLGITSQAHAFGIIAPEEIEAGVAERIPDSGSNSLHCARGIERKKLAETRNAVTRSGAALKVRTAKRTVALVDNRSDGDTSVAYSYLGFSKQLNSHVIHVQYYEGGAYLVIHHQSGQRGRPSGFPIASPDGKHFLSLSEDMFAGYNPNNIEIWRVMSGRFRKVANYEPGWGPHRGNWLDGGRTLILKRCHDASKDNPAGLKVCGVANIERTGSTWKLSE